MKPLEKGLSSVAAALLMVAIFSATKPSALCFSTAICALLLSIYLRFRGAFRTDNTPLLGAFLIGGSSMLALVGLFYISPMALLVVAGAVLVPTVLSLVVFGIRERLKYYERKLDRLFGDGKPPP